VSPNADSLLSWPGISPTYRALTEVCICKTVPTYRSASFDIIHNPISPEFACLIAPRRMPSIGVGTAACDPSRSQAGQLADP
jgi:hypothetical protein